MKNNLLLALVVLLYACTEIPPEVNPLGNDPNNNPGQEEPRRVLIEEFSGVRCVNCPAGSDAIENLLRLYNGRLIAISIHAGFFANPYPESKYDFRTSDGNQLLSLLTEPFGYPSAVVNRRRFDGEFGIQLGLSKWAGYIAHDAAEKPRVRLDLQRTYNPDSRRLDLTVRIDILETLTQPDVRLSVALTEDDVEDVQLTPLGKQADYKHKHVLRDMLSNFDGNPIPETKSAGLSLSRTLTYTLPPDWNVSKCKLVAFVHVGGDRKDVLQVAEIKILP